MNGLFSNGGHSNGGKHGSDELALAIANLNQTLLQNQKVMQEIASRVYRLEQNTTDDTMERATVRLD